MYKKIDQEKPEL